MKKLLIKISALFLAIFIISACSSGSGSTTQKQKMLFMWKAQSDKATVYLLGSVHVADSSVYPLNSKIESAYDSSSALVVEVNTEDINPMVIQLRAKYQGNNTLENSVSKETYNIIAEYFNRKGAPPQIMKQMSKVKPWFISVMAMQQELEEIGITGNLGIDKHFLDKAKDKKEILELETLGEQLDLFDEFDKIADAFIKYSFENIENTKSEVEKLFSLWKVGDTQGIEEKMMEEFKDNPEFAPIMDKMYTQRNIKMTAKIEEYLNTDKIYFVVVGAGHLVGEKGIVNLLEKTGKFKVMQYEQ